MKNKRSRFFDINVFSLGHKKLLKEKKTFIIYGKYLIYIVFDFM